MKEITEIILNHELADDLHLERKSVYFDTIDSDVPRAKYSGSLMLIDGVVLRLDTQMYYDSIPLKVMNTGTEVNVYTDRKKEHFIGKGKVKGKFFVKATKQDWKLSNFIDDANSDLINLDLTLDEGERKAFDLGNNPLSMDDKWFMYVSDDQFHFFRSWTGTEIFKGELVKISTNPIKWEITDVFASREWNSTLDEKKELVRNLIKYGIMRRLKLYD